MNKYYISYRDRKVPSRNFRDVMNYCAVLDFVQKIADTQPKFKEGDSVLNIHQMMDQIENYPNSTITLMTPSGIIIIRKLK